MIITNENEKITVFLVKSIDKSYFYVIIKAQIHLKGEKFMKLSLENENIIYFGEKNENSAWGFVQFPKFYDAENGELAVYIHDQDDAPTVLGEGVWLITSDYRTWRRCSEKEMHTLGTRLPNGDMLRVKNIPTKKLQNMQSSGAWFGNYRIPTEPIYPTKSTDPNRLPHPLTTCADVFGSNDFVYLLDTLPDGLAEKGFCFLRLKKGESTAIKEYANVEWKHRTIRIFNPSVVYSGMNDYILENPALYEGAAKIKTAPDGSLFIAHYQNAPCNPYTGVFEKFSSIFIFRSTDNGKSWVMHGHIPYQPNVQKDEFSYLHSGFCEPDIAFMPDGSMLCIMRTCSVFQGAPEWGATYLSRSYDNGKTWDIPQYFQDRGALPLLLPLDCGVTLAVITRPGIFIYASQDDGKTWEKALEIMPDTDRSTLANQPPVRPNFHQFAGSCCNTDIKAIDKNRAILTYSDFYTPDAQDGNVKKKAIKTVEIVVNL